MKHKCVSFLRQSHNNHPQNFEVSDPFNSPPTGQNGRHFADVIFRYIFVNGKICTVIKIWLMFGPKGPIDNNQALV